MAITFTAYGAAGEVTGSNHILDVDGHQIMIDFGLFQGHRIEADAKNRQKPYTMEHVEGMVLTHAHADHCGRIPLLTKYGYNGNIYCTHATRDVAGIVMADSAHIQEKDYEWLRSKGDADAKPPLYTAADVTRVLNNFVSIAYGRDFFPAEGIKCRLYDAGHIVGSSMAVFDLGHDRKIAFTGDLGRDGLPIVRDPDDLPPIDYLVCESTYGNRLHEALEDVGPEFEKIIKRTVDRGGKIIIPAFAIERTQDILYMLSSLKLSGKIPNIPIYVDSPMGFNVTSIYRVHQECFDSEILEKYIDQHKTPFSFEGLRFITDVSESMALNDRKEPCIIISSSGMCEAGRILHHLKNNIENPKNTVMIVGFMAEHTLGRRIVEKDKEIRIFGKMYKLNAEVTQINGFSAHADYNEIQHWLKRQDLNRLKKVFLVHGERNAQENLKKLILEMGVKAVDIVEPKTPYKLF